MKNLKKTQGAVSIFLVIILVPMMTVSALFVDAGKVRLARGVQETAGDLALNTALTEYDTELKDLYGLFATAQDTTELFEKLDDYYRRSIISSGVGAEEADDIVDRMMGELGLVSESNDVSDILNMQLVDFEVSKKEDASLANSTILKKQIVEFMKYRSPINTGLGFLSSLKSFATLSKQTELVDKRTEYYEEQNSVMETLKKAWDYINEYNNLKLITDEQFFKKIKDAMDGRYKEAYKEANRKTIMDLYDTQNYDDYQCSITSGNHGTVASPRGDGSKDPVEYWSMTITIDGQYQMYPNFTQLSDYSKNKLPAESDFQKLIDAYYKNKNAMKATRASVESLKAPGDLYDLQYLVQAGRSYQLREYTYDVGDLYTSFQKIKHASFWLKGYEADQLEEIRNQQITANGRTQSVDQFCAEIESDFNSTMMDQKKLTEVFSGISSTVTSNGMTDTSGVDSKVAEIGKAMGDYKKTLETAADKLDKARKQIEKAKKSVDDGGKLDSARENWENVAKSSEIQHTSMAKQDLAELDELGKYLNTGDMQKMIDRLKNVADNLRKTAKQLESYKFDGVFIGDIQSYDSLKNTIENHVGASELKRVPLGQSELQTYASNKFDWQEEYVDVSWVNNSGTQVKLHGQGTDKLNFYSYLYTHFNDNSGTISANTESTKKETPEQGKNVYKKIKEKKKEAADKEAGKSSSKSENEILNYEGIPSKTAKASGSAKGADKVETGDKAVKNTSSNLSGMFSGLGDQLKHMGTQLRDRLFISDYILSMLSYDTIEKETKEKSGDDAVPKTLTRELINDKNNYAYQCEVEYILYGKKNASNITKAYASIYAIRLGFNLIYAFTNSEIRDTALAVATPISAATLGVIPVPLIQAAIILAVSCCESGLDLSELRDGEAVPLFKNRQTWHIGVSGMVDYAKGKAGEVVKDVTSVTIDESQKVLIDLLDKTDEELSNNIDKSSAEIQTAVEGAYDTLIARHADTAIQKLTTLANQAVDEAAMEGYDAAQYVEEELKAWGNEGDAGDLGNLAKKEAVQTIISSGMIPELVNTLKETANGSIDGAETKLNGIIDSIRKKIDDKVKGGSDKIKKYKDEMISNVKQSMSEGADSLKDTLNQQLDGIFGDSGTSLEGAADNTGFASLVAFRYSDYLRLFLMIGMITNENAVIMRLADAIQVNMEAMKNHEGYRLSKSATYITVNSTVQVPPTFLALPLFANVEGNPAGDSRWYTLDYEDIRGY